MANKFVQGGDYTLQITATDEAGVVIDLTTLAGYIFIIFYSDNTVLQQYSEQTKAGFKPLIRHDETNGIFRVLLQSADTKIARVEEIFGEVKLETVDVNFDDNTKHDPETGISLGNIVKSQSEQYTDLTA